jgi:hypothetical protein
MTGERVREIYVGYLRGCSVKGLAEQSASRTPEPAGSYAKGSSR